MPWLRLAVIELPKRAQVNETRHACDITVFPVTTVSIVPWRVTALDLGGHGLSGSISASIGNLSTDFA